MTTTINLPVPPSANALWRYNRQNGKPYLTDRYKSWKRVADNYYLTQKRDLEPITGRYRLTLTIDMKHKGRSDLDNRVKALSDYLQRVGLIENDKLCDGITLRWGKTELGCKVVLTPSALKRREAA